MGWVFLIGIVLYLVVAVVSSDQHVSPPVLKNHETIRPYLEIGFTVAVVLLGVVLVAWLLGNR